MQMFLRYSNVADKELNAASKAIEKAEEKRLKSLSMDSPETSGVGMA